MPIIGVTGSQNTKSFLQPNPPTIVSATDVGTSRAYNNGAATVAFTPSASGAPATSYTVTSSPGGFTGTGSSSPITVAGLQSNTAYTFTVTGTNAAGTGQASSASSSVTATTVPQAPTIGAVNATAVGVVTVAYTAGATGGKAVSAYTATSSPSSITGTGASPISVSGLAQKTAYTFTVTATNANGTSLASAASSSVTTFLATLTDTFNRATGALGTSSDGLSTWSVIRNNFTIDSNQAYSTSTDNSLATVTLSTSAISNAQVDMVSDQGGVGLAIWATDANSYWGIYPHYTATVTPTTNNVTTCSGPGFAGTGPTTCASSQNVTGSYGPFRVMVYAYEEQQYIGQTACNPTCSLPGWAGGYPSATYSCSLSTSCGSNGGYNYSTNTNASNVTNTVTNYATNYTSAMRIASSAGVVVNNQYAASISAMKSLAVSTSGNVITYTGYSAANKGGSVLVTSTYDAGAGTKAAKFGVFKAASSHLQGSYVDNISVTVV